MEMTDEEKDALVVLGYSEYTWDSREPISSYKYWGDLTDDERAAAELLGYKASKWNDRAGTAKQPKHVKKSWADLNSDEQNALVALGWSEEVWDEGTSARPESFATSWDDLKVCGKGVSAKHTFPLCKG